MQDIRHSCVQRRTIYLIREAHNRAALSRGVQGFTSRVVKASKECGHGPTRYPTDA